MTVTSVSTPLAQVPAPRTEADSTQAVISASEIKKILYLAVRGVADQVSKAGDHAVDTYA